MTAADRAFGAEASSVATVLFARCFTAPLDANDRRAGSW